MNSFSNRSPPNEYKLDDFHVRTPTDILGQHIHLVKFDVTSSDGAGNGWNYEDGTFSPDEVVERINAIMAPGGSWTLGPGGPAALAAKPHPFFGIVGAQTTVQRWYADDTLNLTGQDRTRTRTYGLAPAAAIVKIIDEAADRRATSLKESGGQPKQ